MIVGAGGAGARLAPEVAARLGVSHVTISNNTADLGNSCSIETSTAPVINPTIHVIRGAVRRESARILDAVDGAKTVVIIASLAGRSGAGIAPGVASICANAGKKVVAFAIMPFRYEGERIFGAGMALKRLRESSDCAVIVDNDAILEGNPNLSVKSCYDMVNAAIMHVAGSLGATDIPEGSSMIAMSGSSTSLEHSLRDAIKMIYENVESGSVARSLLYVMGDKVPVGAIDNVAGTVSGLTGGSSAVVATGGEDEGVKILAELSEATKFDSYDPLGVIPAEKTIDWDEAESSVPHCLDIDQIEK